MFKNNNFLYGFLFYVYLTTKYRGKKITNLDTNFCWKENKKGRRKVYGRKIMAKEGNFYVVSYSYSGLRWGRFESLLFNSLNENLFDLLWGGKVLFQIMGGLFLKVAHSIYWGE